jgi:hypothetical protein
MDTEPAYPRARAHVTPLRALAAASLAAVMGGCVMGPNFQRPETTPPIAWPYVTAGTAVT